MAVAAAGEEVVVGQGDYPLKAPQQPNGCTGPQDPSATFGAGLAIGNRYVHGVAGRPRPRLIGDATSCTDADRRRRVRRAVKGSTITVACAGRGCPFTAKRHHVKRSAAKVSLRPLLRGAKLRPGARVSVSITRKRTVGVRTTLTMRAHQQQPGRTERCLVPGARHASRCSA